MSAVPPTIPEDPATQASQSLKSPSGLSNISGTTARTSHSTHELARMSADDMIFDLPDLDLHSNKILALLAPANTNGAELERHIQELRTPQSIAANRLASVRRNFREVKELYGQDDMIKPLLAAQGMLGVRDVEQLGDGTWRPDDLFYKSNLAILADDVVGQLASAESPSFSWEKLDRDFPEPFLSRLHGNSGTRSTGSSALLNTTFELALAIRIQFTIQFFDEKQADSNFNPDTALSEIFFDEDTRTTFRGWGVEGLRSSDLKGRKNEAYAAVVESFKAHINDDSDKVKVGELRKIFPLSQLLSLLVAWIHQRQGEIASGLSRIGESAGLQKNMDMELRRRRAVAEGRTPPRQVHFASPQRAATPSQRASVQTQNSPEKQIKSSRKPK